MIVIDETTGPRRGWRRLILEREALGSRGSSSWRF